MANKIEQSFTKFMAKLTDLSDELMEMTEAITELVDSFEHYTETPDTSNLKCEIIRRPITDRLEQMDISACGAQAKYCIEFEPRWTLKGIRTKFACPDCFNRIAKAGAMISHEPLV